ncbi:MAG: patatin-like phospholipase family protein [Yoonia sp.]|uniref:patatin-like phospholipase family protein n=1 Tax=Yoonia sp. TaxID=2212373 RepID=UPI00273E764E|nr:patatin-like phospholipase family protein [Yoonia sp.]MDP5084363.1 patatin-like phospholipase family protein [Yoonia sp.]
MSWVFWIIAGVIACVIAAVAYGFLAPLKVHFTTRLPLAEKADWIGPAPDAPFVGLALSGGGARASIFAAAGMEALQKRGLLSGVTHVSSVSGGGFAASYLALHPVPADATDTYFNKMQHVLSHDYFWDTQMGQLRNPSRLFSPSRRFQSLQETLDRPDFLRNATFTDLPTDRRFYFNTVSYDSGQRFVFSNTVLPRIDDTDVSDLPIGLRSLSFTDTAGHRKTPDSVPVSLAVATSAAFPPYLGPMTIEVRNHQGSKPQYWHLGDGGVLENQGVETLREAIYAQKPHTPAIIYSFDAGQELNSDLSRNTLDISIWSRDVTRLVDVLSVYAATQRNTHYDAIDARTGTRIDLMTFNYMDVVRLARSENPPDPKWLSWSEWRYDNAKDRLESRTPADHLAKIPTALKITRCHRELISEAAHFLVNQRFPLRAVPS